MWVPILRAWRPSSPAQGGKAMSNRTFSCLYRRGSPLLIGVRSKYKLSTEQIPILYRTRKFFEKDLNGALVQPAPFGDRMSSLCWGQPAHGSRLERFLNN